MFKTATLLVASASLSVALACPGEKSAAAADAAPAKTETVAVSGAHAYLQVDGVHCHGTASTLQAALLEVEGVKHASVEPTGKVDIAYDSGKTDVSKLIAAVSNIDGYSAQAAPAPKTN